MKRGVPDRVFRDANGDFSDHVHKHIHLTNFIHLENHMERHSPILADRTPMRDLIALQNARTLREPSGSPDSWNSHSLFDLLPTRGGMAREGRRSVDIEWLRDVRRLSRSSPTFASLPTPNVVPGKLHVDDDIIAAISDRASKSRVRNGRRIRRTEPSHGSNWEVFPKDNWEPLNGPYGNDLICGAFQRNSESEAYKSNDKDKHIHEILPKSLLEELNEFHREIDAAASFSVHHNDQEPNINYRGHKTGMGMAKERKFRGARRNAMISRHVEGEKEISVASGKSMHSSSMYQTEQREEGKNVARAPKNGCGILLNWSRIHNRGKSFLDMAGRSLHCGLSDSRLKRGAPAPTDIDSYNIPVLSDQSSPLAGHDTEELPLLIEASESQGSAENAGCIYNYSGELGIFADHLRKHEIDSDLASEARSGDKHKANSYAHNRYQHIVQKYMPRTFPDLVGQSLVAQALSNAVMKRKVGLLYSFYGPHGTGKTSCARIFARALNCQSIEHPKPCGFCDPCVAYDMGKSRNIREIDPASNIDLKCIMDLLDDMVVPHLRSKYRVLIFEDCVALSPNCWSAITKAIDLAPKRVVFVLICSGLNVMPHIIISRCQKFFFPKLKDVDIIYTLQCIANKENLDIEKDALRLIASKSDGSLRDAEMTLEQLSLLGQRISVPLVQEMVGLISDEKLVDLLDSALSSDIVNTVKNLRGIIETGVEPLTLMSQLAVVITDIVAGCYDFTKERSRRSFFQQLPLSSEDMEKLRQALKKLSDTEKHLRVSKDVVTWLTAALLQLAPDQQHILPSRSADTGNYRRPLVQNHAEAHGEQPENVRGSSINVTVKERKGHSAAKKDPQENSAVSIDMAMILGGKGTSTIREQTEGIWFAVLDKIQNRTIKELLSREGELISISFDAEFLAAPTVHLVFNSHPTKSAAERFRGNILQAFESVLGSPISITITSDPDKDARTVIQAPGISSTNDGSFNMVEGLASIVGGANQPLVGGSNEIIELDAFPEIPNGCKHVNNSSVPDSRNSRGPWAGYVEASCKNLDTFSTSESIKLGDQCQSLSLVRSKVCLANVIQQTGGSKPNRWSKDKAISIAEKLEQDNMRLEPRSKSLLCWKASSVTCRKLSFLRIWTRRSQSLLKLVSCGKCLSVESER